MKSKMCLVALAIAVGGWLGQQEPQRALYAEPAKTEAKKIEPVKAAPKAATVRRATPTITVPADVKVAPGRMARIAITTDGANLKYVNVYDTLDIFREYDPSGYIFRVLADQPGAYKIGFVIDGPSTPAYCTVTVGEPPPPVPPVPPGPAPPAPGTFDRAVWDAYQTDPDPQKSSHAAWAASVYKNAPSLLSEPTVNVYSQLLARLTKALHDPSLGMPAGSIQSVLRVIAADEAAAFGTDGTALIDKAKVTAAFAKYAGALSNLK